MPIWPGDRVRLRSAKVLQGGDCTFVIESLQGRLIGGISTHRCNRRDGTFSYGIIIRKEHRRKGYAAEAIRLVLRLYFDTWSHQKAVAEVRSDNEPSIRLHERLGFVREGCLRNARIDQEHNGDVLVYVMSADAFASKAGGLPQKAE